MSGYVDPIAVERAMGGDPVRLTVWERRAAVQELSRRGYTARQIAGRVGCCSRTVVRHRGRPYVAASAFGD